jgi:hypothetical protein
MILASNWYVVVYWNPNMSTCDQMKSHVKITLGGGGGGGGGGATLRRFK